METYENKVYSSLREMHQKTMSLLPLDTVVRRDEAGTLTIVSIQCEGEQRTSQSKKDYITALVETIFHPPMLGF